MSIAITSLAFSAGMVSFLNPCGFALLPVYVTYYFKNEGLEKKGVLSRILHGLLFGIAVSAGFAAVFAVIGLIVGSVGKGLLRYAGWIDLFAGIIMVIIGFAYLLKLDSRLNLNWLTNAGENLKSAKTRSKYLSFFLYGAGFAIASLGCTLPIFLLVVASALKSTVFNGLLVFLIYAAGMSFFMIIF